ncbi:MAG: hypothetical protein Q8Q30_03270 [Candidatus Woesebacteria bacterium]|nr:hypothetical protein [Candidatus Woesebacteria bacterium]
MTNLEIVTLLQRITGITAFALLTLQIYLSSSHKFIKYHKLNGILAYTFVFLHPVLMIFFRYFLYQKIDPFYVFTDVCLLCNNVYEYYINFGRIAFYAVTTAIIAVKFRTVNDWLKIHWRKLHMLNYVAFYAVSIHAYKLGTDSSTKLFIYFFWLAQAVVLYRLLLVLRKKQG